MNQYGKFTDINNIPGNSFMLIVDGNDQLMSKSLREQLEKIQSKLLPSTDQAQSLAEAKPALINAFFFENGCKGEEK